MSSTLVRAKIVKGLGSGSVRRPGGFNPENTGCGMDKIAALNYQRGCLVNPVESIPSVCYSQEEELELKGGDSGDWTLVPEKDDLSKSESLRNTEPPTTRSEASEEGPETPGGCWARGPLRFFAVFKIFIYFWLCQALAAAHRIFTAARGFSLVPELDSSQPAGLVCPWHVGS